MRILVVEDDRLIRDFVVEALREEGYQVIDAACGEEALAWCRRGLADVLVTNIRLPRRIDGWQIAERCREHDPYLPVIYASGFSPVAALARQPLTAEDLSSRGRRQGRAEDEPRQAGLAKFTRRLSLLVD